MATFSEKVIADEYKIHIKDLKEWSSGNLTAVSKIWMKMFDHEMWVLCVWSYLPSHMLMFISQNCGGTVLEATSRLSSNAKAHALKELEGHTGDMDCEAKVDDDEMGSNNAH